MFNNIDLEWFFGRVPWLRDIPWGYVGITIGLFIATLIVSSVVKRLIKKLFNRKSKKEDSFWYQFWGTEKKFILRGMKWIIWLTFISVALCIWSVHIGRLFSKFESLYTPLVHSVIIILIAFLALKVSNHLFRFVVDRVTPMAERRTARGKQRVTTLNHVFGYGSTFIILLITVLMLLSAFGIDLRAVLATVGVASLAVGFGAQSLVKDLVSGVFILLEDQFAVGDVTLINGEGGIVERMTLRITQLRNTEGMLITIPNGTIDKVKNLTSEWSRVDYIIGVAYATDLDHALEVLMDEAKKLREDMPREIIDEPERIGVDEFGDSSITLRLWIKTAPMKQWVVKREYNRRIHKRFEKEGIEIPFPQRTVWIKEPKEALLAALVEQKQ